jgi:hypothetical protein
MGEETLLDHRANPRLHVIFNRAMRDDMSVILLIRTLLRTLIIG